MGGTAAGEEPLGGFGSYLRSQRQLARLTLRQVADLANISNPYLSQIERGLHRPSVHVIRSLAEALNLSADALLSQAAGLREAASGRRSTVTVAIREDPALTDEQKAALLAVYRSMVHQPEPSNHHEPAEPGRPHHSQRRTKERQAT